MKVVYALNTRNEEHESLVAALRSRYEERARQTESTAAAGLREMGEKVRGACEDGERRVEEVRRKLEEEREQLLQKQVSCVFDHSQTCIVLHIFHIRRLPRGERVKSS